jgi:uncharacterized membrane protein
LSRPIAESGSPQQITAAPRERRDRLAWIDLFRGVAVLVMVETHVVNTFLATAVRAEGWFSVLNYINGLVAPSFLFIAGFVQGMERGATPEKPVKLARRAQQHITLILVAYALHFPWTELGQHRWDAALRVGTQVDVLQCIAVSLGLLLGVTWLAQKVGGRRGQQAWWVGLTALLVVTVFSAPLAGEWNGLPIPLQAWVNRSTGSWFPLFSWAGFVFFGAMSGAAYGYARRPSEEGDAADAIAQLPIFSPVRFARRSASVLLITPLPLGIVAWTFFGAAHYSPASPASFFSRAAWVLVLAAFCEWFVAYRRPALPLFAGKHSLTLYVIHLVLISTLAGWGVPMSSISLAGVVAMLAGIATASLALTWAFGQAQALLRKARA